MSSTASVETSHATSQNGKPTESVDAVVVRFCGDSGDGMQIVGTQFTNVSAIFGNDVCTLPDFPAEIRAPAGSLAGVSGYQVCFSKNDIYTAGDEVDTLVSMNPAALKTNLVDLKRGGTLIVNEDAFDASNLNKAHYNENPLDSEAMAPYRLHRVPMTRLTRDAVDGLGLGQKESDRCRNFFALGLVFWLYERELETTKEWIRSKFGGKNPAIAEANVRALDAGYNFGFSTEAFTVHYQVSPAKLAPGKYRKITGNEAVAIGLVTAAKMANKELFFGGYPITPASDILHELSVLKNFGVKTFQAEDEIAAMTSIIGAAFGGALAVTASSGPGIALKGEGLGLAVMTELPMVIVDVQRGGPSTGLPTKTEQSDAFISILGRNGDCPMPVVAAQSPSDCFTMAQEAMRIAVEFMTPVFLLTDGYIANGAEPWRIPKLSDLKPIKVVHPTKSNTEVGFHPYQRDEKLARPWAIPGTPGLEHRIGGLEKADITGNISYDANNHHHMTMVRKQKVENVALSIPDQTVLGPESGDLLVVSWGGTYGSVRAAVEACQRNGKSVAHCHLRYLNPFPKNLGEIFKRYKKVLIPELNAGQMWFILRAKYLVDAVSFAKIKGKPFLVSELVEKMESILAS